MSIPIIVTLVIPAILFIPVLVAFRLSSIGNFLFEDNDTGMLVLGGILWILTSLMISLLWPITIAAVIATIIIKLIRRRNDRQHRNYV
jgi:hypothetical protein